MCGSLDPTPYDADLISDLAWLKNLTQPKPNTTMQTEIYSITPLTTDELTSLIEDGNNSLLRESLGLPKIETKESAPFRFRFITDEEKKVFSVLFPQRTKLQDYQLYIPNEVLEAMQEVQGTSPYRFVDSPYIMSPKEYDPDPVLVCPVRMSNDQHTFPQAEILVARWGTALLPFEELRVKALSIWKSRRAAALKKVQRQLTDAMADLSDLQEITDLSEPVAYHM